MRGERGHSLIELLSVVAILGTLCLVVGALIPSVTLEAKAMWRHERSEHERWLAVRMLRADIHRATSASTERGSLVLRTADGERVVWAALPDGLERRAEQTRRFHSYDVRAWSFRVEGHPRGRLVIYRIAEENSTVAGEALIGRDTEVVR